MNSTVSVLLCPIDVCAAALTHMASSDFLSRLHSAIYLFYEIHCKIHCEVECFFYIVKDHSQFHPFPDFSALHQQISNAEVVSQSSGISVN